MNVIWLIAGQPASEDILARHTLLELHTYSMSDGEITGWYIVDPEQKLAPDYSQMVNLHERLVHGYKTGQQQFVADCVEHLRTRWAGHLDDFYTEVLDRMKAGLSVKIQKS